MSRIIADIELGFDQTRIREITQAIPKGALVLKVINNAVNPILKCLIDPKAENEERTFMWMFGDHKADEGKYTYIGRTKINLSHKYIFEVLT